MGCIESQDQPGNCPECGMKLIEVEESKKNHSNHADHRAEDF